MNWRVISLILIIILGYLSLIFAKKTYKEFFAPKIAVTLYPFYSLTKEIVKDKFKVILIVPPGADPHNYELTPQNLRELLGTRIVFSSGTFLDEWIYNLLKNFENLKIINLNQNLNLLPDDPHFWLSLENMKRIAETITKEMVIFDPKNEKFYKANLDEVLKKLNDLSEFAKTNLTNLKSRNLITQHNAFQYLAKELNLEADSLQDINKEPTPRQLQKIVDKIRLLGIKVIFKEPGEKSMLLETLAKELDLKIYELDPIEGKSNLDYFEAYKKNIEILKEALNQ